MSLFFDSKKSSYLLIRQASASDGHRASISLLRSFSEYVAVFDCATSCADVLGTRSLSVEQGIATFRIPVEEMAGACAKLATRFSVALVEAICGDGAGRQARGEGVRFVLLWKIPANVNGAEKICDDPQQPSLDLDQY